MPEVCFFIGRIIIKTHDPIDVVRPHLPTHARLQENMHPSSADRAAIKQRLAAAVAIVLYAVTGTAVVGRVVGNTRTGRNVVAEKRVE